MAREPGLDQRTLAERIGLDTSTTAGVVERLEAKGCLRRFASDSDKRVKLLETTAEGEALLAEMAPRVLASQARILAPLSAPEQATFMALLRRLVNAHSQADGGPSDASLALDQTRPEA